MSSNTPKQRTPLTAEAKRAKRKRQKANRKKKTLKKEITTRVTVRPGGKIAMSGKGDYIRIPGRRGIRGKGDYFADDYFQRLGENFFGESGKIVGEGVGSVLRAFGLGDYDVRSNSLMSPGQFELKASQNVPRISNSPGGEVVRIRKEEYVGDLFTGTGSPTDFTLDRFDLNPANPALFPWLSVIADNFEEYEFKGLIITLKTMASDVSTAQSLGTMFGATQYDLNDAAFTNKQELLNYSFANSVKISNTVMLPVECDREQNVLQHLYVPTGNVVPDDADPKFYNLGILSIGSYGCPEADSPVAEIWVSYEVDFYKPKLALGGELALGIYSGVWTTTTSWTNSAPLTGMAANSENNFPGVITATQVQFPDFMVEGTFMVTLALTQTTGGAITYTGGAVHNCSLLTWGSPLGTTATFPAQTVNTLRVAFMWMVEITAEGAYLDLANLISVWAGTSATGHLIVTQINGGISGPFIYAPPPKESRENLKTRHLRLH